MSDKWITITTVSDGHMLIRKENIFSVNECVIQGKARIGEQKPDRNGCIVTLKDDNGNVLPDKIVALNSLQSFIHEL